jgi:hypothetical protein
MHLTCKSNLQAAMVVRHCLMSADHVALTLLLMLVVCYCTACTTALGTSQPGSSCKRSGVKRPDGCCA